MKTRSINMNINKLVSVSFTYKIMHKIIKCDTNKNAQEKKIL